MTHVSPMISSESYVTAYRSAEQNTGRACVSVGFRRWELGHQSVSPDRSASLWRWTSRPLAGVSDGMPSGWAVLHWSARGWLVGSSGRAAFHLGGSSPPSSQMERWLLPIVEHK